MAVLPLSGHILSGHLYHTDHTQSGYGNEDCDGEIEVPILAEIWQ